MRMLERRGLLRDPVDARNAEQDDPMTSWGQLSLRIGKLGRVDERGRVLPDDDEARFAKAGKQLCANIEGWSLHAGVTVGADNDVGRENLCRYILRPPISLQRLTLTQDGRVAYAVKYPRGNKTHLQAARKALARVMLPRPNRAAGSLLDIPIDLRDDAMGGSSWDREHSHRGRVQR